MRVQVIGGLRAAALAGGRVPAMSWPRALGALLTGGGRAPAVRALRALAALAALGVVGCSQDEPALPRACLAGKQAVTGALRSAPGAVSFSDGTRLSSCVQRAGSGSELQDVGFSYVNAASALAEAVPRSDAAALQLGYLVGATRRGAVETNGRAFTLLRRMELAVGIDGAPPTRRAAYARGLAAGRRTG